MLVKKKILVFIDWYLPGYKAGGPIQSCANLVEHFCNDFDFYIVTRDTDYCENEPYHTIKSNQWNTLINGSKVYYISQSALSASLLKEICKKEDFDLAYINGVYSFYFSILPLYYLRKRHKKVILATRGMLAKSAVNVKRTKKLLFLKLSKLIGLFSGITFQASTLAEVEDIKKAFGKNAKIQLAANLPKKGSSRINPTREKISGKLKLINIARIAPEKNLKFALEILKDVKAEINFDFYGPIYNDDYFGECTQLIKELPENILVTYKDSIESEKVNKAFQQSHAMLMPTLGENFGHIILESFVAGCPVIISNQTPWRNLESRKLGFDISLSNKVKFVNAIEQLASLGQEEFNSWSKCTFDFGSEYLNNPEILKQNLNLLNH